MGVDEAGEAAAVPGSGMLPTTVHGIPGADGDGPGPTRRWAGDDDVRRGDLIDRYVVVDAIGRGATSTVYKAYDPELDRNVALKVIRAAGAGDRAAVRAHVLREAQAMARLAHPNVVAVYDVGARGDRVFVAMELVDGVDLRTWLARSPPWRAVVAAFAEAGRGLHAAHARGLSHGDFKPHNVFVGNDERVLVGDFGLAGRLHTDDRSGPRGGTWPYMAPEVHDGAPADAGSDQYSLCVGLWEGLGGRLPFAADPVRAYAQKLAGPPTLRASVPRSIRAAIRRGLAPDPADRHASVAAVVQILDRALRPVRWPWVALALGVTASAAMVVIPAPAAVCQRGPAEIETVWNDTTRDMVEHGLRTTQVVFAERTAVATVEALDAYARRWVETYTQVCEATRVDRAQSERGLDARMSCLLGIRAELRAQVEVLASADPQVARNAVRAVGRLPPPQICRDRALTLDAVDPPADEAAVGEVAAVREHLAAVRAMERAGQYRAALPEADAALAQAEGVAYPPVVAEAKLALGRVQERSGAYDGAEVSLRDAHFMAEAHRHEAVSARAAVELVFLLGGRRGRQDEALEWGHHADAAVQRLGTGGREEADLVSNLGVAHYGQADYPQALALLRRGLALKRVAYGHDHYEVAMALTNVGNVLDDQGDSPGAREHHERALAMAQALLGPDHPAVGTVLHNLAGVAQRQAHYEEARTLYRRALTIKQAALGPDHPSLSATLGGLGAVMFALGDDAGAVQYQRRALELGRARLGDDHPVVAASWTNLGNTLIRMGALDEARRAHIAALGIYESRAAHPMKGHALNALGLIAMRRGDLDEARRHIEDARQVYIDAFGLTHMHLLPVEANLARVHRRAGRLGAAQAALDRAEAIASALPDDDAQRAEALVELARVGVDLERFELAAGYATAAHELRQSSQPSADAVAQTGLLLARALHGDGKRDEARRVAYEALAAGPGPARARALEAWLASISP